MYILFKRYGKSRLFKKYSSIEELNEEIIKGHNEKFPGNNQFHYNTDNKDLKILNTRLTTELCLEQLALSKCLAELQ
ncbi:hypothetical protein [Rubrolithibacter danxiaensis]|uniref:hypothetical protein n=1 Tax=Rubrolithibacter danxiaensis TaxID=3390805 RepID=UPI003BF7D7CD